MFKRIKIKKLEDFFIPLSQRNEKGVFFYRFPYYNDKVDNFLREYLKRAMRFGVVISGKIPNPDEKQLSYYSDIMGMSFSMDMSFFDISMKKWLPRLDNVQRKNVVSALYDTLLKMKQNGKNENILKNAYIKFMCWFYYKFERVFRELGHEDVPKIIYDGAISRYELKILSILSSSGCDVVLIEPDGDGPYLKTGNGSESDIFETADKKPFPQNFSIEQMIKENNEKERLSRLYDVSLTKINSTNTWLSGEVFNDSLKALTDRGTGDYVYNMFVKVTGAWDKTTYQSDLFKWKTSLIESGRNVFILDEILPPTVDEIRNINRNGYGSLEQLLADMTSKIRCSLKEVEAQERKAFCDILLENKEENLNKLKNKAVYLVCWINRYNGDLFKMYKAGKLDVFVYFGVCRNNFECLFMKYLSMLPLDIFVINPNKKPCMLSDSTLFEKKYEFTIDADKFPETAEDVDYTTVAYNAEQDLTQMLYQDSGMYRAKQYKSAAAVSLRTMYEEIFLLWDEEVSYRPNFEIMDDKVLMPVLMAKISGVKDGNVSEYWQSVRKLIVDDTIVVTDVPYIKKEDMPPIGNAVSLIKNRKILKSKIKESSCYHYAILRDEAQNYILDKAQELLDSDVINGTFSRGMEYTILNVALNMPKDIVQLINKMDFTKKVPKIIFVCTGEKICSAEDSIAAAFLHLCGFDIAMFVPTGYQVIEKYYAKPLFNENQIGQYMYGLEVPSTLKQGEKESFINRIFKRGR
ncbi:MAG: YceG family protein [Clostridia bacterium]|jgi:hypothetical protein|nr:YceG family protein [Clostridia bacterium]MCI1999708.1 YceG family protein [Clostridia bacterium]MCI2013913.1 YceG family protein [Clostridia bacterium]